MSYNPAVTLASPNTAVSGEQLDSVESSRAVGICALLLLLVATVEAWLLVENYAENTQRELRLDNIPVIGGILLSVGVAITLLLLTRCQRGIDHELVAERPGRTEKRSMRASGENAAARRITSELYTKAVDQLGSDKVLVRLAGLYALERIAQDDASQRQKIVNVLCAYLRMPYDADPVSGIAEAQDVLLGTSAPEEAREQAQEWQVRLAAQRILTDHLVCRSDPGDSTSMFWPDIDLDLTGATLADFTLAESRLGSARFDRVTFVGETRFAWTTFTGTVSFQNAVFTGAAQFNGAIFTRAVRFDGATFAGAAWFSEAIFDKDACFDEATFNGVADFDVAIFDGAVGFSGAIFARNCRFDEAWIRGSGPSWPPGWTLSATASVPWSDIDDEWRQLVRVAALR